MNADSVSAPLNGAGVQTKKEFGIVLGWGVAVILLIGIAFLKPVRTWIRKRVDNWRSWREERAAFRSCLRACAKSDCGAAYEGLRRWHRLVVPGSILAVSAAEYGDPRLLEGIRDLERHALTTRDEWSGIQLAGLLNRWRRFLKTERAHRIDGGLPPLNP